MWILNSESQIEDLFSYPLGYIFSQLYIYGRKKSNMAPKDFHPLVYIYDL